MKKLTPRAVTVTDQPTLLSDLLTRAEILIKSIDNDIALYPTSSITFTNGYPLIAGESFSDAAHGPIYAICNTALSSTVWVWETEA